MTTTVVGAVVIPALSAVARVGHPGGGQRTPKKEAPSKRKQAAAESGDGDEPGESATKKPKMTPKKDSTKKKAEPQPEGGDDEGTAFLEVNNASRKQIWGELIETKWFMTLSLQAVRPMPHLDEAPTGELPRPRPYIEIGHVHSNAFV